MRDAPPAKRAQTQSPSKKQRKARKERPKDTADDSDIVLPPAPAAPAPEPGVKEAPSQRGASGSSSSGPAAVVYAPRNSESEEQEQLRDVGTVYCDGSGDFAAGDVAAAAAPAPSTAPEPGHTSLHTPDTASYSSGGGSSVSLPTRRDDAAPPMLPAGRLFLGDSEIHLLPMFPARTQSNSLGAPRSTAEDIGAAPAPAAARTTTTAAIVKHEDDAMLDEDGTVQSTCPM